jgi:hypothetical protein
MREKVLASFGNEELDDGVVVVAASWMHGDASRLVDDNHVIILVDDADGVRCHRRLVAMHRVRDHFSILEDVIWTNVVSIHSNKPPFHGISVVLDRAIPKLAFKYVDQAAPSPSLLAPSVVRPEIWLHASKVAIYYVRPGPRTRIRCEECFIGLELGRDSRQCWVFALSLDALLLGYHLRANLGEILR